MKIEKKEGGNRLTLVLTGRLETTTAPLLKEVMDKRTEQVSEIVIDMAGLEYVSSAGLRVLLSISKQMDAVDGSLVIKNANEDIRDVFKMTGLDDILRVE